MFASEIAKNVFYIQTKTDAVRVIRDSYDRQQYLRDFGDVVVLYDENTDTYRVPAFANDIKKYCDAKAVDCAKNGSE